MDITPNAAQVRNPGVHTKSHYISFVNSPIKTFLAINPPFQDISPSSESVRSRVEIVFGSEDSALEGGRVHREPPGQAGMKGSLSKLTLMESQPLFGFLEVRTSQLRRCSFLFPLQFPQTKSLCILLMSSLTLVGILMYCIMWVGILLRVIFARKILPVMFRNLIFHPARLLFMLSRMI